jgi:type IV pilus assembly protein PilV
MISARSIAGIRRGRKTRGTQSGFSMIEVLIALVVLGVGLLGLALLQTTNLRFTKSADQRTQAVNLATEMLDMIRANHSEVAAYAAIDEGSFASVTATDGCDAGDTLTSDDNIERWKCEVVEALGSDASADVEFTAPTEVRVTVSWEDEYWIADEDDRMEGSGAVVLETQL